MAEDEKKKQLYGGSYDDAIRETYSQIQNRPAFSYDVDGDALYQQYKDRYTQNAKMAMKDTMGQASALTGGYGSSYAQGVGQQRYDETMRGLTDMIPQLEQSAYQRWQAQGNALQDRLGMLHNMGQTEQATRQGNYQNIANLIASTGYQPSEQEMADAGMSAEQANAMLQMWITSNPDAAYANGRLSPEDYYKLTGRYPIGYTAPGSGGGGGGGYGYGESGSGSGSGKTSAGGPGVSDSAFSGIMRTLRNSSSATQFYDQLSKSSVYAELSDNQLRQIAAEIEHRFGGV